jgi:hypothetical protein
MVILQTTTKVRVLGSLLFLVMFVFLVMVTDTIYLEPPYVEEKSSAEVNNGRLALRITFQKQSNNTATLDSELVTENDIIYLSNSQLKVEEFVRIHPLDGVTRGCVRTTMSYRYRLSLREHSRTLSLACF